MNTDFIEWLVSYAEGFELWDDDYTYVRYKYKYYEQNISIMNLLDWFAYPLLLQRAIEGVNTEIRKYDIQYINGSLKLRDEEKDEIIADYWRFAEIDEAKEQALKYICEKEKEK